MALQNEAKRKLQLEQKSVNLPKVKSWNRYDERAKRLCGGRNRKGTGRMQPRENLYTDGRGTVRHVLRKMEYNKRNPIQRST